MVWDRREYCIESLIQFPANACNTRMCFIHGVPALWDADSEACSGIRGRVLQALPAQQAKISADFFSSAEIFAFADSVSGLGGSLPLPISPLLFALWLPEREHAQDSAGQSDPLFSAPVPVIVFLFHTNDKVMMITFSRLYGLEGIRNRHSVFKLGKR